MTAPKVDLANRALQMCGQFKITTFTEDSREAKEISTAYTNCRQSELRKEPWRCATRRAQLRPYTATTYSMIPTVYSALTAYTAGQVIFDSDGVWWINLVACTGKTPGEPTAGLPRYWEQYFGADVADVYDATVTYAAGEVVYVSSVVYMSLTNGNTGHAPGSGAPWIVLSGVSKQAIIMPMPAGPSYTSNSKNRTIYYLPHGFLRIAAPDPKVENNKVYPVTGGLKFIDWLIEGGFLITNGTGAILLRFVADISDVTVFDPLFSDVFASALASDIVEALTGNSEITKKVASDYAAAYAKAATANWIEIGATEPQEADMAHDVQQAKNTQAITASQAQGGG